MKFYSSFSKRPDPDDEDPITRAFAGYVRCPDDVVPRNPKVEWSMADLAAVAGTSTECTRFEMTDDGVANTPSAWRSARPSPKKRRTPHE